MVRSSLFCGFCLIGSKHGRDVSSHLGSCGFVTETKSFIIFRGHGFSICKMDFESKSRNGFKTEYTLVWSWHSPIRSYQFLEMFAESSYLYFCGFDLLKMLIHLSKTSKWKCGAPPLGGIAALVTWSEPTNCWIWGFLILHLKFLVLVLPWWSSG